MAEASGFPVWVRVVGGVLLALVVAFLALHLLGGGFGGHGA